MKKSSNSSSFQGLGSLDPFQVYTNCYIKNVVIKTTDVASNLCDFGSTPFFAWIFNFLFLLKDPSQLLVKCYVWKVP
jgi:hypothetical protein